MKRIGKLSLLLLLALVMSLGVASGSAMAASKKNGIVTENGVKHYYKNGKLVKNTFGVKYKNSYYTIDTKGVAKKVSNKAQGMAYVQLTNLNITPKKAAKYANKKSNKYLTKAFKWCYNNITFKSLSSRSKKNYAIYGFKYGKGNCNVMAACFYYMAKGLGYSNVTYKTGYIQNNSGGYSKHAWVTIKYKSTLYVFDPDFAFVYRRKGSPTYNSATNDGMWMKYTKSKTSKKLQYTYYYKKNGKYKKYK